MFYWQDVRYALRLLAKNPVFTLLTVVVLAGGLGLSIFTFSFLHAAMVRPLPVPGGERIVRLLTVTSGGESGNLDAADLAVIRSSLETLTELGAYTGRELVVGTGEGTRAVQAAATEWNVFELTRTRPMLGRGFRPDDQRPGAEPVVVLSERAWRTVLGGDEKLLDRHVAFNGVATRVIGVMPKGYAFPVAAEAWVPIRPEILTATRPGREFVEAYARLAPGADAKRAGAELTARLQSARQANPDPDPSRVVPTGMKVQSYPMAQIGEEGPLALAVLNALAALILLLACVNVTNLLLARANERARETAVRLALGAPRARLVVQSMWESVILCLAGGALATALAVWGLSAIDAWAHTRLEGNLPFWWAWGFDRTVLLSAGAFVTVAIAALGGVVAMRAARTELQAVLQEGGSRSGERREGKIARALVITQVAVVSVLMFFGCMSAIVAWRVVNVDLGYDTRDLLMASFELPEERYPDAGARGRFFQAFFERLSTRPEIAGAVLRAPLADNIGVGGELELRDSAAPARPRSFVLAALGPLSPLGIGLREGRFFDTRDVETGEATVILSRELAERCWPGTSALGRQVRLPGLGGTEPWRTVVGVVDDVLLGNPLSRGRSALAAYVPLRQSGARGVSVMFRHAGSEAGGRAAFHQTLQTVDALIAPSNVASFEEVLAKTTLIAKSVATLFGFCFAFALLLASSGTYGLMARSIGRRTRELGVRRALGATDRHILRMLLGQGGRQLGVGALVALPLTLAVGWGFSLYVPIAFGVSAAAALFVAAVVTVVVLAATWLPTLRAIAVPVRDALGRE